MMIVKAYGEDALIIKLQQEISIEISHQIAQYSNAFKNEPYVKSCIPAYASLTIEYDNEEIDFHTLKQKIESISLKKDVLIDDKKVIKLPVCYSNSYGKDLNNLSEQLKLSVNEIIELHTANNYHTYMTGFLPGFPYLGKTDKALYCNRLEQPRKKVEAGSIGLAGAQTGIYPIDAPGGWQLIGKTPIPIFQPHKDCDFLIAAGDEVHFYSVELEEFDSINEQIQSGTFNWNSLYE